MLQVKVESGKTTVSINSSSLDVMQTCLRKAYYSLELGLRSETESAATAFGTAIHKALEHWYSLPLDARSLSQGAKEEAELFAYGHNLAVPAKEGALEAIRLFANARYDVLRGLGENDKRSLLNGVRILQGYFKRYADDGLKVLSDADGPIIERDVEFVLFTSPSLEIRYFGTIDCILHNESSGEILVTDHKTTAALGVEFYARIKPNAQYTGYVMAAQRALSINTSMFMVNGIQVTKTKHEYARQATIRTQDDFDDLTASVIEIVNRYLACREVLEQTGDYRQAFPLGPVGACAMYGGCQYLKIDELPRSMQANAIKTLFPGKL